MKKLACILIFSSLISTHVFAQKARFGIRAGVNISTWGGDDVKSDFEEFDVDVMSRSGFHIVGYVPIKFSERFELEPGLGISTKGSRTFEEETMIYGDDLYHSEYAMEFVSTYLELPTLAKIGLSKKVDLYTGPQFSFLLANKYKSDYLSCFNQMCESDKDDEESTDGLSNYDISWAFGLGYDIGNHWNVRAFYDLGLTKLDEQNEFKGYHRVLKFSLGYTF
ncbi:MAG: porin family protein [Bacteroidota bacterium]